MILSGNTLYGTAENEGSWGIGTVFAVNTDDTGFTNLHNFAGYPSDGGNIYAGLILSSNILYGTAVSGGSGNNGSVFAVNIDGTGFRNLHSFTAAQTNSFGVYTNSDGAGPQAGLILSSNTLYGTANSGGTSGVGTVFAVNTDGTGFTNLCYFSPLSSPYYTNSDGAIPRGNLVSSGNTLYGTASSGGIGGAGTVFAVNTDGTGFATLYSFTPACYDCPNSDGANPGAGLLLSGNTLYGTAVGGGSSGKGAVFSLSFRPQMSISQAGTNVVLSWLTNYAGFDYTGYTLQSTTNLVSPVWTTNSPAPVVVNGLNTVTNPMSGTQQFFRLSQ